MLEARMIEHCAPTLAGLKTANLFNYRFYSQQSLECELCEVSGKLNKKGVFIEVMKLSDTHAMLYVYRKKKLENDLKKSGVSELLERFGYGRILTEDCLERLKGRLCHQEGFPHEIGVFLGYPLHDVIGFIDQNGKNCKYCGIWKVYADEAETIKLFARFKKCTTVYTRMFYDGRPITKLTVAA